MKISDFEINMQVDAVLLLKQVKSGVTNSGKPYLSLTLEDKTGTIDAKKWDVSTEEAQTIQAGQVFRVIGVVGNYQNQPQLKIEQLILCDDYTIDELLKASKYDDLTLKEVIKEYLGKITDTDIHKVVVELLNQNHEKYFKYPAAMSLHHNYVRGLGEHVITMLQVAESLVKIYPNLNPSLLYGGIILHDLGKTIELSGPIATSYTKEGTLLGHISIVFGQIVEVTQRLKLDSEAILLLKHIVLSHHGKQEYGSPVLPLIPEAEIIHFIDNIDARMNMINQAFETIEAGEFTKRVYALDNRTFYKSNLGGNYEE